MESVAENLSRRNVDVGRYSVHVDEPEGVATFMLYDLSGAVVGYQQYRPAADKKKKNHPREGRYYTYKSPARLAVFGLESWSRNGPLFLVEGIFDCVRLHNIGLAAIATLSNDPKGLRGWLFATSRQVFAICDSGDGGRRLAKFASRHVVCADNDLGDMTNDEVSATVNQLL